MLIFSKTTDYRHDSIPSGVRALEALGRKLGLKPVATERTELFSDAGLGRFEVIVFLSASGDVLGDEERAAFRRHVERGGRYVGIHGASTAEPSWPWYRCLVGARFTGHPPLQRARVVIEDRSHPATAHLGAEWWRADEWYEFDENPRGKVQVLLSVDEATYLGGKMGDHPLSWCRELGAGRAFYTALGHSPEDYSDPAFLRHLEGGISWALGR